ncbi:glutathione S-transferase [Altererythrobacter sp. B11]|uniref:glutathione S-transferase family protein n=1 Tax=Altererythrobacter sp. B11 TaxID=2060312 RepID=UPI000DC6E86F|nr:glutathione S-transferase family protein [Altererythrobacter sp. B11]BBC73778.1 glutathione S-transferase [Altererythrobacter sp. B11]
MAEFTFFTNPMSRGQIARWALHEVGADYEQVLVPWDNRPAALLAINPLGKVPTLIHHAASGDRVISEGAAICAYLGDVLPGAGLAPLPEEKADFYRWLFFAAGPIEQGVTARHLGFEPSDARQRMTVGFGDLDVALSMLEAHLAGRDWVCGARFNMADVYVGSQVDWGLQFGTFPDTPTFTAYAERCRAREGYRSAKAVDNALIAEAEGAQKD